MRRSAFSLWVLHQVRLIAHRIAARRHVDPDDLYQEVCIVLLRVKYDRKRARRRRVREALVNMARSVANRVAIGMVRRSLNRPVTLTTAQMDAGILDNLVDDAVDEASAMQDRLDESFGVFIERTRPEWRAKLRSVHEDLDRYDRSGGLDGMRALCESAALFEALAKRPPEKLAVPVMRILWDYSHMEIATARNISVDASQQAYCRFRKQLKKRAKTMFAKLNKG